MVPASKTAAEHVSSRQHRSRPRLERWNLATTLMVCSTVLQPGNGEFAVLPSAEYDGDPAAIVHKFDPFQP
jgi:hypothetical protein